jgi:malate dehydrogenase (oxaloacetate-decarboxylating)(NADP+)
LLHDPKLNKGTAFTEAERDTLSLRGLLPPRVVTQDMQVRRVLEQFKNKQNDLEKYMFMIALQDRNETLFFRVVIEHIERMMPILYTPTVGKACQLYGHIFRRPRGLFISAHDRGRVESLLDNWPHEDVRVIVVTDGERILGLGDLGANGMGIPVGKLSLYTACAGIHPTQTLPITIDVGTDNEELLKDPLYLGYGEPRLRGEAYDELLDEFVSAVTRVFPKAVIQFEDFGTTNAFALLQRYRDTHRCFNDDIQGTASVTLAGLYSATRITGGTLRDQTVLFLGAGEAGTGIGELIVSALVEDGVPEAEARRRCWFVDSKGLVVKSRGDLAPHKQPFAHDGDPETDFLGAVRAIRPTAIVGVSGHPGTFTPEILEAMAEINERPIVFALSNPTSKAECTARDAYQHTSGRAIFASGSPFDPVVREGKTFVPGQGNNAYVFPGIGLGIVASGASRVTDEMFLAAAKKLADETTESDLACGSVYPPLTRIRAVSRAIAVAVAQVGINSGLATRDMGGDIDAFVGSQMFVPYYPEYT